MPNNNNQNGIFDEELIFNQLKASCTVSYMNFIRYGYSKSVAFEDLAEKCNSLEEKYVWKRVKPNGLKPNRENFYSKVLLSMGFKLDEFKM